MINSIQYNFNDVSCDGQNLLDEFNRLDNQLKQFIPFPPQGMTYSEAVHRVQNLLDRINRLISRPGVQNELLSELEQNGMSAGVAEALIGKIQRSTDIDFASADNKEARMDYINEQMTRVVTGLTPSFPPDPYFLIEEYKQLWLALGNPPSKAAVQALLAFVQKNQAELIQLGNQIDYPVCPHDDFAHDLNGLITSLQGYLEGKVPADALYEFAGDIASELGVDLTPAQILANFELMSQFFEEGKGDKFAEIALWMLTTPGYMRELATFAKDPAAFEADAAKAITALQAYMADPSSSPAAAQAALEQVLKDL